MEYFEFCKLRKESMHKKTLDLSEVKWLYPTKLLPLFAFVEQHKGQMSIQKQKDVLVAAYLSAILDKKVPSLADAGISYIPIVTLPQKRN